MVLLGHDNTARRSLNSLGKFMIIMVKLKEIVFLIFKIPDINQNQVRTNMRNLLHFNQTQPIPGSHNDLTKTYISVSHR